MKAIQLRGFEGPASLSVAEVERPTPGPSEVLLEVKAAGLNYAELEQTRGRYPFPKPLPGVMGFEAAGIVVELGPGVNGIRVGDRVTAFAKSGGFAEYATIDASAALPIPARMSFAEATTLTIQGISAYALLELAAKPRASESVLVQAAAGGVGLYLVQLLKLRGVRQIVALASAPEKLELVKSLGADDVVDYSAPGWAERVRAATKGAGIDVVLEMSSGDVQARSLELLAPFGRAVFFGAKNMHDRLVPEQMQRLISNNQSLIFFNFPSLRPEQVRACVAPLLELVTRGSLRAFAPNVFPLTEARRAFEALASRRTIGKVVLVP